MVVLIAVLEVHLPASTSLKDKRRTVKSLTERIHARWRVSLAETAFHDKHQRAEIGIAAVHASPSHLETIAQRIRDLLDQVPEIQVVRWEPELIEESP